MKPVKLWVKASPGVGGLRVARLKAALRGDDYLFICPFGLRDIFGERQAKQLTDAAAGGKPIRVSVAFKARANGRVEIYGPGSLAGVYLTPTLHFMGKDDVHSKYVSVLQAHGLGELVEAATHHRLRGSFVVEVLPPKGAA